MKNELYSLEGKTPVEGYVNCWVDMSDMTFYEKRKGRLFKVVLKSDAEVGVVAMLQLKEDYNRKSPVMLSYLRSICIHAEERRREIPFTENGALKAGKVRQITSKGQYGLVSCPDCSYIQPNERVSCVKCDQSLHF